MIVAARQQGLLALNFANAMGVTLRFFRVGSKLPASGRRKVFNLLAEGGQPVSQERAARIMLKHYLESIRVTGGCTRRNWRAVLRHPAGRHPSLRHAASVAQRPRFAAKSAAATRRFWSVAPVPPAPAAAGRACLRERRVRPPSFAASRMKLSSRARRVSAPAR